MAVVSILNVSILILSLNVIVTLQAPTLQLRNKYTCLPRNGIQYNNDYSKSDWDSCRKTGNNTLRYTAMQSHIIHSLGLPHFQLSNDE